MATALKNKVTHAAGAPGRAAYDMAMGSHNKIKEKQSNDRYMVAKSYNDKKKSGVPVTDKENAQFQMVKDFHKKK